MSGRTEGMSLYPPPSPLSEGRIEDRESISRDAVLNDKSFVCAYVCAYVCVRVLHDSTAGLIY